MCVFACLPVLFYWYFKDITEAMHVSVSKALSVVIIFTMGLEALRIKQGVIIFGMREYERKQVSAQAWGTISTCVVFYLAYPRAYSISPVFKKDTSGAHDSHNDVGSLLLCVCVCLCVCVTYT